MLKLDEVKMVYVGSRDCSCGSEGCGAYRYPSGGTSKLHLVDDALVKRAVDSLNKAKARRCPAFGWFKAEINGQLVVAYLK